MLSKSLIVAATALLAFAPSAHSQVPKSRSGEALAIGGRWDATVEVKGASIPFSLQLTQTPTAVKGSFYDGAALANPSTRGSFRDGALHLEFDSHASRLDARYERGVLRGTYGALPFEARPHRAVATRGDAAPAIAGVWEIPVDTAKGEKAWRLIVKQSAGQTFATILRIDGDTGTLNGRFDGTRFKLSRFAGERPGLLEDTPQADGSLALVLFDQSGRREFKALRPEQARRAGLAAPTDPTRHTSVRDPKERFRYGGVDLAGAAVDNTNPRFKGKVVLLNIMGSWCPNCHDEAAFLASLDAKYRARGLEVVGLDFEQPEQLQTLGRLKAFIARYGLKYTVLVAGEPKDLNAKLPQAVGLNAWPTTFFIARDGTVRSVHVGFPSRGSGAFDVKARADISREIETLLAERG